MASSGQDELAVVGVAQDQLGVGLADLDPRDDPPVARGDHDRVVVLLDRLARLEQRVDQVVDRGAGADALEARPDLPPAPAMAWHLRQSRSLRRKIASPRSASPRAATSATSAVHRLGGQHRRAGRQPPGSSERLDQRGDLESRRPADADADLGDVGGQRPTRQRGDEHVRAVAALEEAGRRSPPRPPSSGASASRARALGARAWGRGRPARRSPGRAHDPGALASASSSSACRPPGPPNAPGRRSPPAGAGRGSPPRGRSPGASSARARPPRGPAARAAASRSASSGPSSRRPSRVRSPAGRTFRCRVACVRAFR